MSALSTNRDLLRRPVLLTVTLMGVALALTWTTTLVPQIVPRHHLDPSVAPVDSDYIGLAGIPRPFIINDPRDQKPPIFSDTELAANFLVDFGCVSAVVLVFIFFAEGIPYLARRSSESHRASPQ
jgi:hypothetical protein